MEHGSRFWSVEVTSPGERRQAWGIARHRSQTAAMRAARVIAESRPEARVVVQGYRVDNRSGWRGYAVSETGIEPTGIEVVSEGR